MPSPRGREMQCAHFLDCSSRPEPPEVLRAVFVRCLRQVGVQADVEPLRGAQPVETGWSTENGERRRERHLDHGTGGQVVCASLTGRSLSAST